MNTNSHQDQNKIDVRVIQVAYDDAESTEDRLRRVTDLVKAQAGADFIMLPELWAPGYFTFDHWVNRAETLEGETVAALAEAARQLKAVLHLGTMLERKPDVQIDIKKASGSRGMWNTAVVLGTDGNLLTSYQKIHPFGFGEGEPTLIDPGQELKTFTISNKNNTATAKVGLATCYDLRFPELFRKLLGLGSKLFAIPAAWPTSRIEHWQILGQARAIENQSFVIQCNTAGTHGGVEMGGSSQIISPMGKVLARAGHGEEVIKAVIDLAEVDEYRKNFPVLADRRFIEE